jgi:hypothetical protein
VVRRNGRELVWILRRFKMKVELGDKVKDTITGFAGKVVCITSWITGCDRVGVQPPVGKDKIMPEMCMIDEPLLEIVEKRKVQKKKSTKGGPIPKTVMSKSGGGSK